MQLKISINIPKTIPLLNAFNGAELGVVGAIDEMENRLKTIGLLETPIGATGGLRQNFHSERPTAKSIKFIWDSLYAAAANEGTRPHWTPISNLRSWAGKKGINVFALWRHIGNEGTLASRFRERAQVAMEITANKIWGTRISMLTRYLRGD